MTSPAMPSGFVSRPALTARLEDGAARAVTVVAAPAGSGKTVGVRSWLEGRESAGGAAWISVERGERDSQRFWSAVVRELRAAAPAKVTMAALAPTPAFDGAAVMRRVVSGLASLEPGFVLVIDDLHEIVSPDTLEELSYFLDHLPSTVHVVLITRRDPQLGLRRRQLDDALTEVRSADMKFTIEETREMMSSLGIALSDGAITRLHDRTEGWVAGLRLAALSLTAHPDPERFVAEFSGSERTVAEYLLTEVLDSQPPEVRRLLVRASLLTRVNGELGDLLTGSSGAERQLQALADAGGFVVALDAPRTWFRFHSLFADLLAVELRHREPAELPRLHLAAGKWHAEHGDIVEAIAHIQAAGEDEMAVGLLIDHYFSLTLDGRQATAHDLLTAFNRGSVADAPELAMVVASDQLAEGSLEQAADYLALAERSADAVPEDRRHRFDLALLVTRLSYARHVGDFRSVADEVRSAGSLVEPRTSRDISINNDVRALMLMNLGIVEVWSGHLDEGERHLAAARDLAARTGRHYLEVGCRAHLSQAISWRSFTRARAAGLEAIALAESHDWGSDPVIAPALVTVGAALLQAGRLDEAEHWLARAEQVLRPELEPAVGCLLSMAQGAALQVRGRHAESFRRYRDAERLGLVVISGSPLAVQLRSATLLALLGSGEIAAVRSAVAEMTGAERDVGEVREVRAVLAMAQGDAQAAVDILAPTLHGSADVHHPLVVIRSALHEATAYDAMGESLAAEAALERALDLAEPDGLILPFLYVESRTLLERHPHHRTAHGAFIAEILDVVSGRLSAHEPVAAVPILEALSDAELRVLRFLPTNLSAAGIAGEIYLSVNTVKTHMRHIYAKLDAHNRVQAVQRGRELGLLGHSSRRG
jgi:LuxR family maltose regulon positive regulatory protein